MQIPDIRKFFTLERPSLLPTKLLPSQQLHFIVNFINQYSNRIDYSWIRFLNNNFHATKLDPRRYYIKNESSIRKLVDMTIKCNSSPVCWLHFAVILHWPVLSIHNMCTIMKFAFMRQHMPFIFSAQKSMKYKTKKCINKPLHRILRLSKAKLTPDRTWNFTDFLIELFVKSAAKNSSAWSKFSRVSNWPVKCLKQIEIAIRFTLRKR